MENRDKDIHRIQEIRLLLESRQRFFCEKLDERLNSRQNAFTLMKRSDSPNEPSIGASVGANFGSSTPTEASPSPQHQQQDLIKQDLSSDEEEEESAADENLAEEEYPVDYSADLSHNSSSAIEDSSDENNPHRPKPKVEEKKKIVKLRRRRSQTGRILGKWISKNVEQATWNNYLPSSANSKPLPSNINANSFLRKKSVTFDESLEEEEAKLLKEKTENEPKRERKKSIAPNPLDLLRKQSLLYKMEVAKKLDDNLNSGKSPTLRLNKATEQVDSNVKNESLVRAREKLEEAEKSLRDTVKTTENVPVKRVDYSMQLRKSSAQQPINSKHALFSRKALTRLGIKNAEEAIKSDLNLREAFAMIKIDPDPILDLATATPSQTSIKKSDAINSNSATVLSEDRILRTVVGAFDESETTKSLKRLTKLSVQHQKKQKSLIPDSVTAQIILEDMKGQSKKLRGGTGAGDQRSSSFASSISSSRRKSSTVGGIGFGNLNTKPFVKKRSKDYGKGPKLAFAGLEASLKAERSKSITSSQDGGGSIFSGYHYVQKLSGTIL